MQVEKECNAQKLIKAQQAQEAAEHAAAHDKQRADDLQHQLVAAQQEHQRSYCCTSEVLDSNFGVCCTSTNNMPVSSQPAASSG